MATKTKRKYTFRKNKILSYESGSIAHFIAKNDPSKVGSKMRKRKGK